MESSFLGFLSGFALVMLVLVGYSAGITLAGRGKKVTPMIWDLPIVIVIWITAFSYREPLGRWLVLAVFLLTALVISFILTKIRTRNITAVMPDSELPEHAKTQAAVSSNPFRRAWDAWNAFGHEMGAVQGKIIMGFFYFVIVTPFGLGLRWFSDPMTLQKRPNSTGWSDKEPLDSSIETAKEQG